MEITQITAPEEINEDGLVNAEDLQIRVNKALGLVSNSRADLNGDGVVDPSDIQQIVRKIVEG